MTLRLFSLILIGFSLLASFNLSYAGFKRASDIEMKLMEVNGSLRSKQMLPTGGIYFSVNFDDYQVLYSGLVTVAIRSVVDPEQEGDDNNQISIILVGDKNDETFKA